MPPTLYCFQSDHVHLLKSLVAIIFILLPLVPQLWGFWPCLLPVSSPPHTWFMIFKSSVTHPILSGPVIHGFQLLSWLCIFHYPSCWLVSPTFISLRRDKRLQYQQHCLRFPTSFVASLHLTHCHILLHELLGSHRFTVESWLKIMEHIRFVCAKFVLFALAILNFIFVIVEFIKVILER